MKPEITIILGLVALIIFLYVTSLPYQDKYSNGQWKIVSSSGEIYHHMQLKTSGYGIVEAKAKDNKVVKIEFQSMERE